jgi:uncharacterized membrane protein (UPF0127 family)
LVRTLLFSPIDPVRRGRVSAAAIVLLTLWIAITPAAAAVLQNIEIVSKSGVHVFAVELAVTDEERARGLMFRRELPEGRGMLFDFKSDGPVSMWMKNTYIALDMIFIQADGRIIRIAENTEPMSTRIISSGGSVRAVLEVAGGTAKKLGIAPGDRVAHPIFRSR